MSGSPVSTLAPIRVPVLPVRDDDAPEREVRAVVSLAEHAHTPTRADGPGSAGGRAAAAASKAPVPSGVLVSAAGASLYQHLKEEAKLEELNIDDDYLEILLQFGYISLFAVAWPLAPLVVVGATWLGQRLDTERIMRRTRRPVPEGVQDVGAWQNAFASLAVTSVITNCAVCVFPTVQGLFGVPSLDWHSGSKLWFLAVAPTLLFAVKYLIAALIPDEPHYAMLQLKRQAYLVDRFVTGSWEPPARSERL